MKACPNCQTSYPPHYTHCPRDGSVLVEAAEWQEGTTIRGKYRILSRLGEGGMAVVYKAMHMRFEELRALKVMNTELAGDHAFVKRFMQEAVLTRKIQHPNAVRVDDIDEAEDGRPFMVMEYLEGRGLKEVIHAEAPMLPVRVSVIARQIAGALDTAHRLGVVHRDVKPANIVLNSGSSLHDPHSAYVPGSEQAKVLDFGIAKAKEARLDEGLETGATLTRTGSVIGTPAYMSPEQARGMRGADLDGRSDIYSLGIVVYQMLAGGLPFKAETSMEWLLAHLQVPPTPLREFRSDLQIPPALAEVVMRCLEKDPNCRPASAAALIQELEHAESAGSYSGAPTVYFSPSQPAVASSLGNASSAHTPLEAAQTRNLVDPATQPSRSSRKWLGWTAAVVVLLAIAAATVFWYAQRSPGTAAVSPPAPSPGQSQANPPPVPSQPAAGANSTAAPANQSAQPSSPPATPLTSASDPSALPAADANLAPANSSPLASSPRKPPAKSPGLALAIQHAKDAENQGRFEDALQAYELASALDPSDATIKRHIALLRARISKENDLIR